MYRESALKPLLEGRKILIAGFGREGKSTYRMLESLGLAEGVKIVEGNEAIREEARRGYDLIVKSPGIPGFVLEDCCDMNTVTSQTDLFLQVFGDRVIGITGTKGKSTTTHLVYKMMQEATGNAVMAGNMGIPLFDVVEHLKEDMWIVCEYSCHQLENIHRGPKVGAVLNLFQEHLDHYHSYPDYKMAKMQIGLKQQKGDYFFYCSDNDELKELTEAHHFESRVEAYSLEEARQNVGSWERRIQGDHNLSNIELVRKIGTTLGIAEGKIAACVADFNGLEHRLEPVGTFRNIQFYNDSISTIPAACMAAVRSLSGVQTLILGGLDRGIDYTPLVEFLPESGVENIAFVGAAGKRVMHLLNREFLRHELVSDDYEEIVKWCYEVTEKGRICLLSPAAASYDSFKNFEERGRCFKALVEKYQK